MCELLGMSFNLPIQPRFSFNNLVKSGAERNPDGWGVAFYPDKSVQILKEPISGNKSRLSKFVETYPLIKSNLFIAHVRNASIGSISYENTHPFSRQAYNREYVFAHNGTINNFKTLKLGLNRPVGDTDSEYVFCHLLSYISKYINRWNEKSFWLLWRLLRRINNKGKLNCIFSNGSYLFCYRSLHINEAGLNLVRREDLFDTQKLEDKDFKINLINENTSMQKGYVVATRALTKNEKWIPFEPGELIVFGMGELKFSSIGRK